MGGKNHPFSHREGKMDGNIYITALTNLLNIKILILIFLGAAGGMVAGALPGITATMSVALLIPFTFTMDPIAGLVTLGAIYCGAIYGGCFSAILINTPGTPSSIGTCFDGFPMAKQGRAEEAIAGATTASVVGGIFGTFVLLFLSPFLADQALKFGPPEYFWLGIFGLTIIASLTAKSIIKGLIGGMFGVLLSTIGIAPIGGDVRFSFGQPALQGGVSLIPALIGFFCIPEVLNMIGTAHKITQRIPLSKKRKGVFLSTAAKVLKMPVTLLRSMIIGVIVGIIPGAGGNIANLVAYNETVRASKHPEKFGTGMLEGVVSTESANNAEVEGSLVPLLTLGIPGAPPAAVLFGALMLHGLRPGPELFAVHTTFVYTFIISLFFANIMMLFIGIFGGRMMARAISATPVKLLAPFIVFLCIIGSYAIRNQMLDVVSMFGLGLAGYGLKKLGFHPGPIVLGIILGPIIEEGFVQSLLIGKAWTIPWTIFFVNPISVILIILCILSASWPFVSPKIEKIRDNLAKARRMKRSES